jgi:hypothetical protein
MNFGESPVEFDRRTRTVHLQGVGRQPAKPAGELVVGDRTMWNTGSIYVVESITPKASGRTLDTMLRDEQSGKVYPRRFVASRMVAIVPAR